MAVQQASGQAFALPVDLLTFLICAFLFFAYICVGASGMGVTDSCELLCGYWELKPGPLEEQQALLTDALSLVIL